MARIGEDFVHEAKTHLSRLIREALEGEEVLIAGGNRPLVRLEVLPEARGPRRPVAVYRAGAARPPPTGPG